MTRFALLLALPVLTLSGCATFFSGGAPRTSPEQILARTRDIDAQLTEELGPREPATEGKFPNLPLATVRVTSPFHAKGRRNHQGVDLDARRGTAIAAAADGIVVHAGEGMRGYGLTVVLRHGRNISTLYAHAEEIIVSVGDRVKAGQTVGYVGSTGNASGPHLHFEVRRDTAAVDPVKFLAR